MIETTAKRQLEMESCFLCLDSRARFNNTPMIVQINLHSLSSWPLSSFEWPSFFAWRFFNSSWAFSASWASWVSISPSAQAVTISMATWGICTRRAGKLERARSRLYRSQILQVNMRLKALQLFFELLFSECFLLSLNYLFSRMSNSFASLVSHPIAL